MSPIRLIIQVVRIIYASDSWVVPYFFIAKPKLSVFTEQSLLIYPSLVTGLYRGQLQ